jgi:hypothetical protein
MFIAMVRVGIYVLLGAVLVLVWYFAMLAYQRRKAGVLVSWLEKALAGHGQIAGVRWLRPSLFQAALRLRTSVFRHPLVSIRMKPREFPLNWFSNWWQGNPEVLVFEADLDSPPSFNLEVRSHRWCGRTAKRLSTNPDEWTFEQTIPIVLTSRSHWEREVTSMMNALLSCREREFLSLGFHRSSPHFTASVLLDSISPRHGDGTSLFEMLRELAAGASTFR